MSAGGKFPYDVFISYSSRDRAWVRGELLTRLEKAGLTVFIDFRDFTRGAPSIMECERGVRESRKTLLILTSNYVEHSEWGEMENVMAQTLSPANRDLRMIPLLKTACEKPLRIAALTHVDFTEGADLDLAWRQLLTALGAPPELPQPKEPDRPNWYLVHPYPMPPNFTGRVSERGILTRWLNEDTIHPLLVLRALGGFGKSALTWHWLTHDVDAKKWPRVVWWSFYEGDASFDRFVVETLAYLHGGPVPTQNLSVREALVALLNALRQSGTLLVLDGFERVLRAFSGLEAAYQGDQARHTDYDRDCVSPLAENFLYNLALQPQLHSKVLLTTRLSPRIVEARGGGHLQGCREVPLLQMQPEDAVAFFHAQGIRGTHTEIELACEPYGYHPLSLRLLAGLIIGDLQQPGDIAAAKRLDVSGDLVQRQHHVLKQAYDSLTPARQKLLGAVACFRWPVNYAALKGLSEAGSVNEESGLFQRFFHWLSPRLAPPASDSEGNLDLDLRDLVARGLVHRETSAGRFDLHPIVRHYAYDRLAPSDRVAAHTRLRDYFATVPRVTKITRLEDLAPVIELYHHTARTGQFDEAFTLYSDCLSDPLYHQLGAYLLIIDLLRALFPDGEDPLASSGQAALPRLKDESHQAWTLNLLANSYRFSGQPHRAVPLFEQANDIDSKRGAKRSVAIGSGNVAVVQLLIGALRAAESNLHRNVALGNENYMQMQGVTWADRALRELLWLRSLQDSTICDPQSALSAAQRTLALADETARIIHPYERDYVRAHWLLGAAHRVAGQSDEAERHLHEALERCRRISLVEFEADILIDFARLRTAARSPPSVGSGQADEASSTSAAALAEAGRLAEEALLITERSGYVLQGADAHLELTKLALIRGDRPTARDHAQKARDLAYCDGPPDHTYKAAYEEALAQLKQLA